MIGGIRRGVTRRMPCVCLCRWWLPPGSCGRCARGGGGGVAGGHGVAGADEWCAPDARGEGDASREGGGVCVVARG